MGQAATGEEVATLTYENVQRKVEKESVFFIGCKSDDVEYQKYVKGPERLANCVDIWAKKGNELDGAPGRTDQRPKWTRNSTFQS